MLRVFLEREDTNWVDYLPTACLAYNTKVRGEDNFSPYELLFGHRCRLPLDLIIPLPTRRFNTGSELVRETNKRFVLMYAYIANKRESQISRNSNSYSGKKSDFKVGDQVWIYLGRKIQGKSPKMSNLWLGKWTVSAVINEVIINVKPADFEGKNRSVHVSRVRHYYPAKNEDKHDIPWDIDNMDEFVDGGDEFAEDIYLGEADDIDGSDLLYEIQDPPLPDPLRISYPKPQILIKDLPKVPPLGKKHRKASSTPLGYLQSPQQLDTEQDVLMVEEAISVPLTPIMTPVRTPRDLSPEAMGATGGPDLVTPSKVPLPEDADQVRSTRGVKRKDATPSRIQQPRKAKLEQLFKRSSALSPLPYQRQPKNPKKSALSQAASLVTTPSMENLSVEPVATRSSSSSNIASLPGVREAKG